MGGTRWTKRPGGGSPYNGPVKWLKPSVTESKWGDATFGQNGKAPHMMTNRVANQRAAIEEQQEHEKAKAKAKA